MNQYIYVDIQGNVGIDSEPPTRIDLEAIGQGELTVIEVTPASRSHGDCRPMSIQYIEYDGTHHDPDVAYLDLKADPYHWMI